MLTLPFLLPWGGFRAWRTPSLLLLSSCVAISTLPNSARAAPPTNSPSEDDSEQGLPPRPARGASGSEPSGPSAKETETEEEATPAAESRAEVSAAREGSSPATVETVGPKQAPTGAPEPQVQMDSKTQGVQRWVQDYQKARSLYFQGRLEEAASAFEALVLSAPTPEVRKAASELARLARDLHAQGMQLVEEKELAETELGARLSGKRSTDELAQLYLNAAVLGIGTGIWTGTLTDGTTPGIVLPMLGVTAAGITGIALIDAHERLKYGVPQSIVSGLYLGLAQGSLWTVYAASRSVYLDPKAASTAIWLASVGGATVGGLVGSLAQVTPGGAGWTGSAALWTSTLSALTAVTIDPYGDGSGTALSAALGHTLGALGGALSAEMVAPSIARVRYLDLGGLAGGLLFGGVYALAADGSQNVSPSAAFGSIGAGILAGLGTSFFLTRNLPKDRWPEREKAVSALDAAQIRLSAAPTLGGAQLGLSGRW